MPPAGLPVCPFCRAACSIYQHHPRGHCCCASKGYSSAPALHIMGGQHYAFACPNGHVTGICYAVDAPACRRELTTA